MPDWAPIKLNARVLGHISQGMYRTPAGAIKELITNAYDGGAETVTIHTDFPRFLNFSCKDDGYGILQKEFERLMTGGIGNSTKPLASPPGAVHYERPIVGRLGVGLLSLAQICSQFEITSHHYDSETAFSGSIKFSPYIRQAVEKSGEANSDDNPIIEGGFFKVEKEKYDATKKGVLVTTSYVRDSFIKTMTGLKNYARKSINQRIAPYQTFDEYLNCIYSRRLSTLFYSSAYDQLILGLATASPIPYPDDDEELVNGGTLVIRIPEILTYQDTLKQYKFRVLFDNLELSAECKRRAPQGLDKWAAQDLRDFFMAGWPKELLKVAKEKGWNVEVLDHIWYDRRTRAGKPYQIICLVLQFESNLTPRSYLQNIL